MYAGGAILLLILLGRSMLQVVRRDRRAGAVAGTARTADWAAIGLLATAILGTIEGGDLELSLPRLAGLLFALGVYFAVRQHAVDGGEIVAVVRSLTLCGLGVALAGSVGTDWPTHYPKNMGLRSVYEQLPQVIRNVPSAHGTIAGFHANEVAGVLALLLPIGIVCTWGELRGAKPHRWAWAGLWGVATAAMAGYVALSVSRNAWLSLGVALPVMVAAYAPRAALRWGPAAGVLGAIVVYLGRARLSQGLLFSDLTWSAGTWDRPTRPEIWQRALQMIIDHPWTGIGLNAFPYVIQTDYPFPRFPDYLVPHAHNLYLQSAVDYGLPGLLCVLVLIGCGARGALRTLGGGQTACLRLTAAGVIGALCAYAAFGVLDAVAVGAKPTFLPFAVIALGVSLGQVSDRVSARRAGAPVEDARARPVER
jgi:putative inorganic carbon (HCO3(-)) transporter